MKRTLFILLLSIIPFVGFGQKIHFCDTTNLWIGLYMDYSNYPPIYYQTTQDRYTGSWVAPNGKTYLIGLTCLGVAGPAAAVREDTIAGKVYYWDDSLERVLYDYNLQVNDTVTQVFPLYGTYVNYVSSIDSTEINGLWYRVWHFEPVPQGASIRSYDVIEGIGTLYFPLYPLIQYHFEDYTLLTCFYNRGMQPLVNSELLGYFDNATSCALAVEQATQNVKKVTVIPNPIISESKLLFPSEIDAGTLTIYNDVGQCLVNKSIAHQEYERLGDKANTPGIYFYRLTDEKNKRSFTGKFVKE